MIDSPIPFEKAPLQRVRDSFLDDHQVNLYVQREDLIHPVISGNKWYKLKLNLKHAKERGFKTVLSFGGAYSNHIHALSAASGLFQLQSIGVIRGGCDGGNPTLRDAKAHGMQLHFASREEYAKRCNKLYWQQLQDIFGGCHIIPEGGNNIQGVLGSREIMRSIQSHGIAFDRVAVAAATGATLAGLIQAAPSHVKVLGVSTLKGEDTITSNVLGYLNDMATGPMAQWQVFGGYHCGGYARVNARLLDFMERFSAGTGIPLEPIYTGKLFYALYDMVLNRQIPAGANVVAVHTGGLQGLRGMQPLMDKIKARVG